MQENADLDDDLLVVAGDNLFDYSLARLHRLLATRPGSSAVALYDVGDLELAKQYGIVTLDEDDRIVGFVEKPADPPTTLCATATYLYAPRPRARSSARTSKEGTRPTSPGTFVAWLHRREPVYGYRATGGWYDIGDAGQLLEADNRLRARAGLPLRNSYSLG